MGGCLTVPMHELPYAAGILRQIACFWIKAIVNMWGRNPVALCVVVDERRACHRTMDRAGRHGWWEWDRGVLRNCWVRRNADRREYRNKHCDVQSTRWHG